MAVPERWDATRLAFSSEDRLRGSHDFCWIGSDELVGAFGNRDGAFGVFAKSAAGDAEGGGFFLNATGVREDEGSFAEEAKKSR
jgi:hypothetical protein